MNLLNKYLSDEELNHIYETYDIEFINKIDEENFWKIINYLKQEKSSLILIDSALGEEEKIGSTYINIGGIEIGKAFGKSFYFPANLSIKTVVGIKGYSGPYEPKNINYLAKRLANKIINNMYEIQN